jgi:methyl-accepting chemotaxis protein
LRLHKVQKYGDDLSSFRKTVVEANSTKQIVSGIEVGVGGLGVRLVHPVTLDGSHIGTMEFGTDFSLILKNISEKNNLKYALGVYSEVFNSANRPANKENDFIKNNIVYFNFSDDETKNHMMAIDKNEEVDMFSNNGIDYSVISLPIKDYSGKEIGYATFFKDETAITSAIATDTIIGILVPLGLAAMLLVILVFIINKKIIYPLEE